jgi:hypothetical protein
MRTPEEFRAEHLPERVTVEVAFAAMAHFLAYHFNARGGSQDVRDFISSISSGDIGNPRSPEILDRFKDSVIDADHMEQVGPLVGPK